MWFYDLGLVGLFGFVFSFVLGFFTVPLNWSLEVVLENKVN